MWREFHHQWFYVQLIGPDPQENVARLRAKLLAEGHRLHHQANECFDVYVRIEATEPESELLAMLDAADLQASVWRCDAEPSVVRHAFR